MARRGAQRRAKASGLKYAVLGLLVEQPSYGYSLISQLTEVVGDAYRLKDSAVYVAIDTLKADGYVREVERQPVADSKRTQRVMYAITPEGREAVAMWLSGPAGGSPEPARSELVRRLAFSGREHAASLLEAIDEGEMECVELIAAATRRQHALAGRSAGEWEAEVERLVHGYGISYLQALLDWHRDARAVVTRFAAEANAGEAG